MQKQRVTIYLEPELLDWLRDLHSAEGRSLTGQIEYLLALQRRRFQENGQTFSF
ncbi:MAG: hypothetical protein VKL42_12500 [Snowella sp.]|nr:hypothetical protein [Snowella sp.]